MIGINQQIETQSGGGDTRELHVKLGERPLGRASRSDG